MIKIRNKKSKLTKARNCRGLLQGYMTEVHECFGTRNSLFERAFG